MNLGDALDALKEGKRVALPGGNPDIWLVLVPGSTITVTEGRPLGIAAPELVGQQVQYCAHIDIHGIDGTLQPWGGPGTHHLFADEWEMLD